MLMYVLMISYLLSITLPYLDNLCIYVMYKHFTHTLTHIQAITAHKHINKVHTVKLSLICLSELCNISHET
jgi:hypothetical protein